jgi:hypothetical protein
MTVLRRLVVVGPGSIRGQSMWGFVVDRVALGQVFLRLLMFTPVSIIPLVYISPTPYNISNGQRR